MEWLNSSWSRLTQKFRGTPDGSSGVAAEEEEEVVALRIAAPAREHVVLAESKAGPNEKHHRRRRRPRRRHLRRPSAGASYWRHPPTECLSLGTHLKWTHSCRGGPFLPSPAREGPAIAASNDDAVVAAGVEIAAEASWPRRPSCLSSSSPPLAGEPPRKSICRP